MARSLRSSFAAAAAALALFGLGRFAFNLVAVRVFGPVFVGNVNVSLSGWTVVTILLGTVPAFMTSKFVAESTARGEPTRGERVFSAALVATALPGLLLALVVTVTGPSRLWVWYVPVFATYMVVKAAAFAFGRLRSYVVAEVVGFVAFAACFTAGSIMRSPRTAELSLLLQPTTVLLLSLWTLRDRIVRSGIVQEFVSDWRAYGGFWGATMINAVAGLASYHLVVVLAGLLLADRASVGYLSVILSSLAPINFLPSALGTSLFPELARRYGAGDEPGQQRALSGSVVMLQAIVCGGGTLLLLMPELALRAMHLPSDPEVRVTWILLAWVLQLVIVSSPCGHYLNATRFAGRHALASLAFLVIGLATGIAGFLWLGLVGAGLMRVGVDAGLAWVRMAIADRTIHWSRDIRVAVIGCQVALVAALIAGLLAAPWPWRAAVWVASLASQVHAARRAFSPSATRSA